MLFPIFIISDWNWTSPISLARNQPVAHFICSFRTTNSALFKPISNLLSNISGILAIKFSRINHNSLSMIARVIVNYTCRLFNYLDNIKIKFLSEFIISIIMSWYRHNCTFTISTKNIITNPDWNPFAIYRVNRMTSSKNSCFLFVFLTFNFRFFQ